MKPSTSEKQFLPSCRKKSAVFGMNRYVPMSYILSFKLGSESRPKFKTLSRSRLAATFVECRAFVFLFGPVKSHLNITRWQMS